MKFEMPFWLTMFFIIAAVIPVGFFYRRSRPFKYDNPWRFDVLGVWVVLQVFLGTSLFYANLSAFPPRLLFLLPPPVIWIIILFASKKGRAFIDSLDAKWLTWLHVVRIPVEITLFFLATTYALVPVLMTFEGHNFDIISGITAIPVAYYGYHKKRLGRSVLLAWNFICLGLLLNIVINAVLAIPSPLQQQAFDQPNIAVLYFPYNVLPAVIVPMVLFSHLVCIRQLLRPVQKENA